MFEPATADYDADNPDADEIDEDTARLYAKPPNPSGCPNCRTTLDCTPTGHTCPACGFHDPAVCPRHTPPPDLIEAELEYRRLVALGKHNKANGICDYIPGRGPAGRAVAEHPWLQQYPAGPERRAARKILRTAVDNAAAVLAAAEDIFTNS